MESVGIWNWVVGIWSGLGLYMFTPYADWSYELAGTFRVIATGAMLAIVVAVVFAFRDTGRAAAARRSLYLLAVVAGMLLLQAAVLYSRQKYWGAGKALSYSSWPGLVIVLLPLAGPYRGPRPGWFRFASIATLALALVHGAHALARPVFAARPYGIHYRQPYPNIQGETLKRNFDWADFSFLKDLTSDDLVAISMPYPWIRAYVRIALMNRKIPHYCTTPVYETDRQWKILGHTQPIGTPTVAITLAPGPDQTIYRVHSSRLSSTQRTKEE